MRERFGLKEKRRRNKSNQILQMFQYSMNLELLARNNVEDIKISLKAKKYPARAGT
jgi:hypothetical protein